MENMAFDDTGHCPVSQGPIIGYIVGLTPLTTNIEAFAPNPKDMTEDAHWHNWDSQGNLRSTPVTSTAQYFELLRHREERPELTMEGHELSPSRIGVTFPA